MQRHRILLHVMYAPDVLARITALFARRGVRVESVTVDPDPDSDTDASQRGLSMITVEADLGRQPVGHVIRQLNGIVHVLEANCAATEPARADDAAGSQDARVRCVPAVSGS